GAEFLKDKHKHQGNTRTTSRGEGLDQTSNTTSTSSHHQHSFCGEHHKQPCDLFILSKQSIYADA
ncbi:hypothetical protein Q8G81_35075, partial [Klebsiella pneumoniae]